MTKINPADMIAYLKATALGKPYVFDKAGPSSFDCSGLVVWGYKHFGVDVVHYAATQARLGVAIARNAIEEGDLVFSNWDVSTPVWGVTEASHVGIAVSKTHIIVAPHSGENVQIEDITGPNWQKHLTGVRRYDMASATPAPTGQSIPIRSWATPVTWDMTVSGIAEHFGYGSNWQAVWNSQPNAAIRVLRKEPSALHAGDRIIVTPK